MNYRRNSYLIFVLSFLVLILSCKQNPDQSFTEGGWQYMNEILREIKVPEFPEKKFNITDFGASTEGKLSTEAFRQAIIECNESGGGTVIVPAGDYLTGAIHLLSNVRLHLEKGAIIRFSTNPKDYLPLVVTRFEGMELYNYSPLIYAYEQENIAVTGDGILDGQASNDNWWLWKGKEQWGWKEGMPSEMDSRSFPRLFRMSEYNVPLEERVFGEGAYLRPSFVQPYKCKNILIEGVEIKNPPMWMLHPVLSQNITIRNVKLYSQEGPNGDGCDPESSKDILIEGSLFNNGDDCIAIKSGRNRQGYELGIPTENIVIRDCIMKDGHGGIVLGSELSGGIRNVYAYDCYMDSPNLERALRIKSNKYRGGVVENVFLRNIRVGEVRTAAIHINQRYSEKGDEIHGPELQTVIRNVFVDSMRVEKAKYAIEILGTESQPVENVEVTNSSFNNIEEENVTEWVNGLILENVIINAEVTPDK
jgi:polygalacturonase